MATNPANLSLGAKDPDPRGTRGFQGGPLLASALCALATLAVPGSGRAETATIYGSLGNFDVVNHTGQEAHGFEIELEGLQESDVGLVMTGQRRPHQVVEAPAARLALVAPKILLRPVEAAPYSLAAVAVGPLTPACRRSWRMLSQHCASLTKCLIDIIDVLIEAPYQKAPKPIYGQHQKGSLLTVPGF